MIIIESVLRNELCGRGINFKSRYHAIKAYKQIDPYYKILAFHLPPAAYVYELCRQMSERAVALTGHM